MADLKLYKFRDKVTGKVVSGSFANKPTPQQIKNIFDTRASHEFEQGTARKTEEERPISAKIGAAVYAPSEYVAPSPMPQEAVEQLPVTERLKRVGQETASGLLDPTNLPYFAAPLLGPVGVAGASATILPQMLHGTYEAGSQFIEHPSLETGARTIIQGLGAVGAGYGLHEGLKGYGTPKVPIVEAPKSQSTKPTQARLADPDIIDANHTEANPQIEGQQKLLNKGKVEAPISPLEKQKQLPPAGPIITPPPVDSRPGIGMEREVKPEQSQGLEEAKTPILQGEEIFPLEKNIPSMESILEETKPTPRTKTQKFDDKVQENLGALKVKSPEEVSPQEQMLPEKLEGSQEEPISVEPLPDYPEGDRGEQLEVKAPGEKLVNLKKKKVSEENKPTPGNYLGTGEDYNPNVGFIDKKGKIINVRNDKVHSEAIRQFDSTKDLDKGLIEQGGTKFRVIEDNGKRDVEIMMRDIPTPKQLAALEAKIKPTDLITWNLYHPTSMLKGSVSGGRIGDFQQAIQRVYGGEVSPKKTSKEKLTVQDPTKPKKVNKLTGLTNDELLTKLDDPELDNDVNKSINDLNIDPAIFKEYNKKLQEFTSIDKPERNHFDDLVAQGKNAGLDDETIASDMIENSSPAATNIISKVMAAIKRFNDWYENLGDKGSVKMDDIFGRAEKKAKEIDESDSVINGKFKRIINGIKNNNFQEPIKKAGEEINFFEKYFTKPERVIGRYGEAGKKIEEIIEQAQYESDHIKGQADIVAHEVFKDLTPEEVGQRKAVSKDGKEVILNKDNFDKYVTWKGGVYIPKVDYKIARTPGSLSNVIIDGARPATDKIAKAAELFKKMKEFLDDEAETSEVGVRDEKGKKVPFSKFSAEPCPFIYPY